MKKILVFLSLFLLFSMTLPVFAADIEMATSVRYDWFSADNHDTGTQFLMPVRVNWNKGDFDLSLVTAYVSTDYNQKGGNSYSLTGFIDTQAKFGYHIIDRLPFDLLLGLDINIPTGQTELTNDEVPLTLYDDLYTITSFGEGWNFNPTLVIVKNWQRFSAGIGIGYALRGEYDFSDTLQKYDPGNKLTLSAEANYDLTPEWLGRLFVMHSTYGKDQIAGNDYFQEGDFTLLGLSLQYQQEVWDTAFTVKAVTRGKARLQQWTGNLYTENEKSIGDEFLVDVLYRRRFEKMTLRTLLQLKFSNENDYPETSVIYAGAKRKASLSIGLSRPLSATVNGEINLKGFYLDKESVSGFPVEDRTYTGASIMVGISAKF